MTDKFFNSIMDWFSIIIFFKIWGMRKLMRSNCKFNDEVVEKKPYTIDYTTVEYFLWVVLINEKI